MQELTKNKLNSFVELIAQGIACWQKAGEIVVELIDEDGMTVEDVAAASQYLTCDIVGRFEQMGRKQLLPSLLTADYPAAKYLARLPYSEQERLAAGQVELLLLNNGNVEILKCQTQNLTSQQCRQVFHRGAVRDPGAQRAFLESERERLSIAAVEPVRSPYVIRKGKVFFNCACELTATELKRILKDLR